MLTLTRPQFKGSAPLYAGNATNTAADAGKILAILEDYTDDLVTGDLLEQCCADGSLSKTGQRLKPFGCGHPP